MVLSLTLNAITWVAIIDDAGSVAEYSDSANWIAACPVSGTNIGTPRIMKHGFATAALENPVWETSTGQTMMALWLS